MERSAFFAVAVFAAMFAAAPTLYAADSASARKLFQAPTVDYSSGPLWVWNDMMTDEQILSTMRDMASQNVKQLFVHPRPGLMTPYLSDEWFRLWKLALDEARKLDMNIWIYDENSYPSGFAGGHVPEAMPESRIFGLRFKEETTPTAGIEHQVGVYRITGDNKVERLDDGNTSGSLPSGRYITAFLEGGKSSAWHAGRFYVDLMREGVAEKFIEVTLEPYRKHFPEEFGKRIPGVFTDEPHVNGPGYSWTPKLPEVFKKRWGYDLLDHLPSINLPVGDWKRVRHNYYQTVGELFTERWGKTLYEYCEKHNLDFTGHFWDHGWPNVSHAPDTMALYSWQQRPALDCLMNNYSEDCRGQFGNVRMAREVLSVANQLGRERTLCEAYGACGWDFRFEDMKRITDWLCVLGVNTINQHLSYVALRGSRKRDHPVSFSYHSPWWQNYQVMADYIARMSAALSQGKQINEILLLQPTTTAYMYQAKHSSDPKHLDHIGNEFAALVMNLERNQVEYDIGSEYVMERHGSVEGDRLRVGEQSYHTVIIPPLTENINKPTADLLDKFVKGGGKVLCCGAPPSSIDGAPSDRADSIAGAASWSQADVKSVAAELAAETTASVIVRADPSHKGILFHHRRRLDDGELLFLVNTSISDPAFGHWEAPLAKGAEEWDLMTGNVKPASFEMVEGGITGAFRLEPCGSKLLFIGRSATEPAILFNDVESRVKPAGDMRIERLNPNVLVLDYLDYRAKDKAGQNRYCFHAAQEVFKANGLDGNPWESATQYKDEIIRRDFPPDSGFEAIYRFTISGDVPSSLGVVIERGDLFSITCNDKPIAAKPDQWWLDKAFTLMDISRVAKQGENTVQIKAKPFTVYHELEPAYLVGTFAVDAETTGFSIKPDRRLKLGSWKEQGNPFYGGHVTYTQQFNVENVGRRSVVKLGKWNGAVAEVHVNGSKAGLIGWAPWECDVTKYLKPGENEIRVVVTGTLRNPLGPHHAGVVRGTAWPANFHKAPETGPPPGSKYDVLDYGLFEPFTLLSFDIR